MSDVEIGEGAKPKRPSTASSSRPSRNLPSINYKKLNEGEICYDQSGDVDVSQETDKDGLVFQTEFPPSGASKFTHGWEFPVHSSNMADTEQISAMKRELEALNQEEECLRQRKEADDLRRQLADKRKSVASLRGKIERSMERDLGDTKGVNIETLRKSKKLRHKVNKQMKELGLFSCDELSSQSGVCSKSEEEVSQVEGLEVEKDYSGKKKIKKAASQYSFSSTSDSQSSFDTSSDEKTKKKHKKKIKSGIKAKASDSVKRSQKYPQAHLRFEFVSSNVTFEKLDLNLFVAGELEIISNSKIRNTEKTGRLELLKKIMYLSTSYEFPVLKSYYAAVLREIELGRKSWKDDFYYIETAILSKHTPKNKSWQQNKKPFNSQYKKKQQSEPTNTEEKTWFCSQYQRNKCQHKGNHILVIKGKARHAMHICASCWLKDNKKLEHPECSTACPHTYKN